MKVVFLDVDGVLNTIDGICNFGMNYIDDERVQLVAKIINATDAKIVLSSTWRIDPENRKLVEIALSKYGLTIFDATLISEKYDLRKNEIQQWLDQNPTDKFAIIDDWSEAGIGQNLFQTNNYNGLTHEIAEKVIEHFSGIVP